MNNDYEKYAKRRKIILIILSIGFIGLVILSIILAIFNSQKTATLDILVAPSFANIQIDNHKFSTSKTIKYYPGEYTASISADGFEPQEINLSLVANEETTLYISLTPTADNANFYDQHPEEAQILQIIGDRLYIVDAENYTKDHPIVNILPIVYVNVDQETGAWTEYRIDYGQFEKCKSNFCVKISDVNGTNREHALQNIRDHGYNPDDYEILYEYTPVNPIPESTIQEINNHYGVN